MKIVCFCSSVAHTPRHHLFFTSICLTIALVLMSSISFSQIQDGILPLDTLKKLSLEELMNIEIQVTSVSKKPEKLTAAASAIQVITQEDIRRSGATNLPEALRLAPNLQIAQVNSSQWAISARGFNNVLANKLLVMIDGRTVYTPLYAGVFWDIQNILLEDVDRIEVISGPGGTLWGANAVNGVINIITKNSEETKGIYAEFASGTKLDYLGSLRYGGKLSENLTFRVYGTAYQRNNTILDDSSDANDEWAIGQGGFRLDWDPSQKDMITLQSDMYSGKPNPNGDKYVKARGGNILGRWTRTISERSDFQLQVYYDHTFRDFRNEFTERLQTYDLDWQHRFQIGQRQNIMWGAGIRVMDHKVTNLELFGFFPGHKLLNLYSAFLQDEITLIKKHLLLTLGSKFEHHTYTGFQVQPSGRLTWIPRERHTLWAAVSRAIRTPSRIDRDFAIYAAPGFPVITGSKDFKPEEVIAYELGWRLTPNEKLSISLSSFYNIYDNIRSAEPGPPITFSNGVQGETYGIELSVLHQLFSWWHLRGGYTYLEKELSIKPSSADLNQGTAESNDPEHQFLIQSSIQLPWRFELGTVVRYIDQLPKPYIPGYLGLDVRLGWKVNNIVELNIVGQNLTKSNHTEFIPASPSPRKIERSVYGKILCRF